MKVAKPYFLKAYWIDSNQILLSEITRISSSAVREISP